MRGKLIAGLLLIVAAIHLMPVVGALGAERLASLYGIEVASGDLEILMRHRAVLFGILGAILGYAAFRSAFQPLAVAAGLISVISFLVLAYAVGGFNDAIGAVVIADFVALAALSGAAVLLAAGRSG